MTRHVSHRDPCHDDDIVCIQCTSDNSGGTCTVIHLQIYHRNSLFVRKYVYILYFSIYTEIHLKYEK